MKRFLIVVISAVLPIALSYETASAKTYKNCTELSKKYKNGVAKSKAAAGSSRAHVSASIYTANKKMDRDKDGVICES